VNIFVISKNPKRNAKMLDNKRLVKMVLETAQLLSNACWHFNGTGPYRKTHWNHPCSVWTRDGYGNYSWTLGLFKELCAEYTHRYGRVHKCEGLLGEFERIRGLSDQNERIEFVNCTNFKTMPVFMAYRMAMRQKWTQDKRRPEWGRK
jgi:hypothetical protein